MRRSVSSTVIRSSCVRAGAVSGMRSASHAGEHEERDRRADQRHPQPELAEADAGGDAGDGAEQLDAGAGGVQRPGLVLADLVGDPGDVGAGRERPPDADEHLGDEDRPRGSAPRRGRSWRRPSSGR